MTKNKIENLGQQTRFLSNDSAKNSIDIEKRTATFPFSSEQPVSRWYGDEILSHEKNAMNLMRLNQSASLLFNHDRDQLIGVVEKAWLGDDKRLYCDVRFSQEDAGAKAMREVQDGILTNVSFAYSVEEWTIVESKTGNDTYTATKWTPLEVSFVTIPADFTVGIGRDNENTHNPATIIFSQRGQTMPEPINEEPTAQVTVVETSPAIDMSAVRNAEIARQKEINAMGAKLNVPVEMRDQWIGDGLTIEQARGKFVEFQMTRTNDEIKLDASTSLGLSEKEKQGYSIVRAINAHLTGNWKKAGFERSINDELASRFGDTRQDARSILVPTEIGWTSHQQRSAYNTGATATGGALVANTLLPGEFIDVLRPVTRVLQQGARVLSGLTGNVRIPKQATAGSAGWVTEDGAVSETEATFDEIDLSIKTLGAYSYVTRSMLMQSTPDIEQIIRADLIAIMARAIDSAALHGTGTGVPTGISNTSGVNSIIGGTNGGALTIDHLIYMEGKALRSNYPQDSGDMAYLGNADTMATLKLLKATTGQYLWTESPIGMRSGTPGSINGYTYALTNQCRNTLTKGTGTALSELFFGPFNQVLIGQWGVLEILPNPYDSAAYPKGGVLLRAMQSADIGIRYPNAFSVMSDAITSLPA